MAEILTVLIIAFFILVMLKVVAVLFKVGFVIALLPLKLFAAFIALILTVMIVPFTVVLALFAAFLPFIIVGLMIAGLVYLLK